MRRAQINTGPIAEEILQEIVRRLVQALRPVQVYLFGSQVYGTPGESSDVDLMIVLPGPVPPVSECYRKGHASLRGLRVPVELHFASAARFERRRTVAHSLEREVIERGSWCMRQHLRIRWVSHTVHCHA